MRKYIITIDESENLSVFTSIKKAAEWHLGNRATQSRLRKLRGSMKKDGDQITYHGVKYLKTTLNNE